MALVLFVLIPMLLIGAIMSDPYDSFGAVPTEPFAQSDLPPELRFEGDEITTADGTVISYRLEDDPEVGIDVSSPNISLTNMQSGESRMILPKGSEQMIMNWNPVGPLADGKGDPSAYIAFVGTKADYTDGYLDLILGDLRDLRQTTLRKRVRFVDGVRMLNADTVSMIVWVKLDEARFWIVDLRSFEITLDREVDLPAVSPQAETLEEMAS
ncbi:MAG: hypothetical protein AAF291_15630 [Pseudomonadota bacterium]